MSATDPPASFAIFIIFTPFSRAQRKEKKRKSNWYFQNDETILGQISVSFSKYSGLHDKWNNWIRLRKLSAFKLEGLTRRAAFQNQRLAIVWHATPVINSSGHVFIQFNLEMSCIIERPNNAGFFLLVARSTNFGSSSKEIASEIASWKAFWFSKIN